jgi:hypothetical protein
VLLSKKVDSLGKPPPPDADLETLEANGALLESFAAQYSSPVATQLTADIPAGGTELTPFAVP